MEDFGSPTKLNQTKAAKWAEVHVEAQRQRRADARDALEHVYAAVSQDIAFAGEKLVPMTCVMFPCTWGGP